VNKDYTARIERQKEIKRQANEYANDAFLYSLIANKLWLNPIADAVHQYAMRRRNG